MLGPFLLLIYVNNLPTEKFQCTNFTDDGSLFSKVININDSLNELNMELDGISQWVFQ